MLDDFFDSVFQDGSNGTGRRAARVQQNQYEEALLDSDANAPAASL